MKLLVKNVVNLWFGADTPLRQLKLRMHPEVWAACQKHNRTFRAPSGAIRIEQYRKSDRVAFAEAVLRELGQAQQAPKVDTRELV